MRDCRVEPVLQFTTHTFFRDFFKKNIEAKQLKVYQFLPFRSNQKSHINTVFDVKCYRF